MHCPNLDNQRIAVRTNTLGNPQQVYHGFLYKILNSKQNTLAYLFGTIHKFGPPRPNLNRKVYSALEECQTFFPEINVLNKENVQRCLRQAFPEEDPSTLDTLETLAMVIEEAVQTGRGCIDFLLLKRAVARGMAISQLETQESRRQAKERAQIELFQYLISERPDKQLYDVHLEITSACFTSFSCLYLASIRKKIEAGNRDIFSSFLAGSSCLFLALLTHNVDRKPGMIPLFENLLAAYQLIRSECNLNCKRIDLVRVALLIKKLSTFFDNSMKEAYKKGDETVCKLLLEIQDATLSGFIEDTRKQVDLKDLFLRDCHMAEQIEKDLLLSNAVEGRRSFYAVGLYHLLGPYENLLKQIEKKGWKVVRVQITDENV